MNPRRFIGLGLLVVVAAVVVAFSTGVVGGGNVTTVSGLIGGEKSGLMADPAIVELLRGHDLVVEAQRAGSLELVRGDTTGQDFLWPSSEVALALYEQREPSATSTNVFNSPIVLYSWQPVVEALTAEGLVSEDTPGILEVDLAALAELIQADRPWADLGLPDQNGSVRVDTTDPTLSNSGNMFSGLLANSLNEGRVATPDSIEEDLPAIEEFYDSLGFLENSSGDLFESYLQLGRGARPMIVGYENQLIEFGLQNPTYRDIVRDQVRILYPEPTVWSSHPIIPLTEGGERLEAALRDPELLGLAWESHGFRSGAVGAANDPADLGIDFAGIPAEIDQVIPMPAPAVMDRILAELED